MKLLNCLQCNDIQSLIATIRFCACQKSAGAYRSEGLHAVITGPCRVLGVENRVYNASKSVVVVPYRTAFSWFPILPEKRHHVEVMATVEDLQTALRSSKDNEWGDGVTVVPNTDGTITLKATVGSLKTVLGGKASLGPKTPSEAIQWLQHDRCWSMEHEEEVEVWHLWAVLFI